MPEASLDTDDVVSMYELAFSSHRQRWEQEGHRSYAHGYYETGEEAADEAVEAMVKQVASVVDIDESDRVLNLGSGVGDDAIWVARTTGASVVGVNVHDRQLELAREFALEAGVDDRVSFRYDDFHELETVEADSFDVVWGLEALCHSADDARVVREAARVLDDDGRLVFADLFCRRSQVTDAEASRLEKLYDAWDVRYDPVDELEAALEDQGFRDVGVREVTDAVRPSIEHDYRMSLYGYPYYRVMSALGRADRRLADISIGAYHCQKLFESGLLGYYFVSGKR